ncbi:MAG: anti-sigma F factor [Caldicoprobacterales bacterium]|jgi:stage II sporulation protein AB (anti-sigma F factor)|nr:anti-sigma F factor [Clostridia bacterium]MDI9511756.1 anti-sigma F factor [Bacillota bacterium]NLH59243.1 anti-sigma F factor [Clostridiales bacterium]
MERKNEMRLQFLSRSQNESFARAAVAAFAAQLDPTLEEIADIKTAVSEAVTNAIIHGYESPDKFVEIITRVYDSSVEIEVIDRGKGIDNLEQARQPLYTSKPELERSGMGFTVMETFMDDIEVTTAVGQGTRVKMIKHIKSNKGEMGKS